MNINMESILIIRINEIFRVSFTFFTNNSLLDNIMNPSKKRGRDSIEKSDEKQKSEQSSDQSHWYSAIASSKQKRTKLINDNMLEQMMSWFQHQNSKIPGWFQKFNNFAAQEALRTVMRLKMIQKRMMTILITIKSLTRKFKVITCENNYI